MEKINFKIATPERVVFKDDVDSITLPTQSGEITILPNHIPMIGVLVPGEIQVKTGGQTVLMAVSGGFVEVLTTKVVILADTAEKSDEIDIIRAEEALARAQKLKEEKSTETREYTTLVIQIEKELARLRVGRKHRERVEQRGVGVKKYK